MQTTYEEAAKKYGEDPSIINQNLLNEAKEILEQFYEEKDARYHNSRESSLDEHGERSSNYF